MRFPTSKSPRLWSKYWLPWNRRTFGRNMSGVAHIFQMGGEKLPTRYVCLRNVFPIRQIRSSRTRQAYQWPPILRCLHPLRPQRNGWSLNNRSHQEGAKKETPTTGCRLGRKWSDQRVSYNLLINGVCLGVNTPTDPILLLTSWDILEQLRSDQKRRECLLLP